MHALVCLHHATVRSMGVIRSLCTCGLPTNVQGQLQLGRHRCFGSAPVLLYYYCCYCCYYYCCCCCCCYCYYYYCCYYYYYYYYYYC